MTAIDDHDDELRLVDEVSDLIEILKREVGLRWMSCELRLKIEEVEILLREL